MNTKYADKEVDDFT